MKTVEEEWKTYEKDVLPADAPEIQRSECKLAFFAGAQAMFTNVLQIDAPEIDENVGADVIRKQREAKLLDDVAKLLDDVAKLSLSDIEARLELQKRSFLLDDAEAAWLQAVAVELVNRLKVEYKAKRSILDYRLEIKAKKKRTSR